ncbi:MULTISPECIES: hypothetical protein [Lysobacter]|uniref:Uncharacterized protein n=1 Tax=Lysobacter yananisis TaxID=1003114 RepID=A0ABY9PD59_9GAMM|nr:MULTISPECIES: hypothetical protein [Lysobacter]QQQ00832.1 hypothetical protein JHW41_22650 [Lysobacter enzymogenes]UZW61901.1 hypothetical protein BV903_006250 [Lysobacter enzymogenes]WMT04121.1 hypothetical protein RDV84_04530 [Lysobacter yananisis]
MDDRSVSNDSILDFARFVSTGAIEKYREEYSDFPRGAEVEDVFAKALVDQYRREKGTLSIPAQIQAEVSDATPNSSTGKSVFPLDFDIDLPLKTSLHVKVTNPSDGEYVLTATFTALSYEPDKVVIRFKDGVLSRTEDIKVGPVKVHTKFTLDFSDGFHVVIEGHVETFINLDFGPIRLP